MIMPQTPYTAAAKADGRAVNMLEWGAGGSTFFYSRHVAELDSVEHHPDWSRYIARTIKKGNHDNIHIHSVAGDHHVLNTCISFFLSKQQICTLATCCGIVKNNSSIDIFCDQRIYSSWMLDQNLFS